MPAPVLDFFVAREGSAEAAERTLGRLRPSVAERERWRSELLRGAPLLVLDEFRVIADLHSRLDVNDIPVLGIERARVSPSTVKQHPGLFAGAWGVANIRVDPDADGSARRVPVLVTDFEPIRGTLADLSQVVTARGLLSTDEYLDLLVTSLGLNATRFTRREKLLLLVRAAPLAERNLNLVELGQQGTGKSFMARNMSGRAHVVSGGSISQAQLFVNLNTNRLGTIATRDTVVFDEVSALQLTDAEATVALLKDFMESGRFARGQRTHVSGASLVFTGNIEIDDNRPHRRLRHLFEPFPAELRDPAFIDRLHGFIPGWSLPKLTPTHFAAGDALAADAFQEILALTRQRDWSDRLRTELEFVDGMTQRDQRAVVKLTAALLKLLHPHGEWSRAELVELATLASELRQRVHNQLVLLRSGEFRPRRVGISGMPAFDAPDLDARATRDVEPVPSDSASVGVVTGLVASPGGGISGGDVMVVQARPTPNRRSLEVTGAHGQVLEHSVRTAHAFVRDNGQRLGLASAQSSAGVHVHLREIAEMREGPSAGVTFVAAIVSALSGRAVRNCVAMTGEVSLVGEVLEVGSVPAKVVAAYRAGKTVVFVPADNEAALDHIPDDVLAEIEVRLVHTVEEVLEAVLVEWAEAPGATGERVALVGATGDAGL